MSSVVAPQVRCFVSLVSQPEVDLELGGPYQEWVQDVLEEVEPEADPVPCAQANVDDCLIGVVRWTKALARLGQCTTFVVQQLRAGVTVYLHCRDGVGRTGIVSAAVVGILARLPAEEALARAEDAHAKRRFTTRSSPETEEQRTMVRTLLDQHGSVKREPASATSATSATEPEECAEQAKPQAKVAQAASETPKPPRLPQKNPELKLSERSDTIEFFAVPVAAPEPDSKPVTPSVEPAEAAEPAAAQAKPAEPGAVQAEGPLTAQQELRRMQQRFAATAEGLSGEEAEELERLRLKRLADLKAAQKAKQEELERRYDAYCAQKAQDDR
eukprot:COSAG02_NODE_14531_length_1261_cov_5.619853_1_plen_328_part_10